MYINAKMIPVETISGMEQRNKGRDGGLKSSMIYLIHCKNFCKCHSVSPPSKKKESGSID
jgi:hypothetical protein